MQFISHLAPTLASFASVLVVAVAAAQNAGTGVSDSVLEALAAQFSTFTKANAPKPSEDREAMAAAYSELRTKLDELKVKETAGIDAATLTVAQLIRFREVFPQSKSEQIRSLLTKFADAGGIDSIDALLCLRDTTPPKERAIASAGFTDRIFASPALADWIDARGTVAFVQAFSRTPVVLLNKHVPEVLAVAGHFKPTIAGSGGIGNYMKMVLGMGPAVDAASREALRARLLDTSLKALAEAKAASDAPATERLERSIAMLDSSLMKGTLINNPAPGLEIIWARGPDGPKQLTSLDQLKGKVVVLDFWATWCGPCVGSFPKMRELNDRYSDDDVVLLGVTSIQGRHHPRGKPAVDCKDDPAREQQLMEGFMTEMGVTWPVVFTKQAVFNPAYDVTGIPHIAIIDSRGNLRYNDLHPSMPLAEKAALIDALLREQGKDPPPAPVILQPTDRAPNSPPARN